MKLNKYALVLFLGLGTLTSCNDNLELLNPNQQTSNTFGFNADDLEESVIAAYNHIRMEGSTPLTEAHDTASAIEARIKALLGPSTLVSIHLEPRKR